MKTTISTLFLSAALALPIISLAGVPQGGMSKSEVRNQFGAPQETRPAVGQPPISSWKYPGFTVYFENDLTLHSVREGNRQAAPQVVSGQPAKPATAAPSAQSDADAPPSSAPAKPAPSAPAEPVKKDSGDAQPPAQGGFRFDPVSGRIVMESDAPSAATAEPEPQAPAEAPTTTAADSDNSTDSDTTDNAAASSESAKAEQQSEGGFFIDWNNS